MHVLDSIQQALSRTSDDSLKFRLLLKAGELYAFSKADSSLSYTKEAVALAEKKKSELWKAYTNIPISYYFFVTGDIASALKAAFENIEDYPKYQDAHLYALSTTFIGILYMNSGNHKEAMNYATKSLQLLDTVRMRNNLYTAHFTSSKEELMIEDYMVLAMSYLHFNKLDSALLYGKKAYDLDVKHQLKNNYPLYRLGLVYIRVGNTEMALSLFRRAVLLAASQNITKDVIDNYNGMAEVFKTRGETDSAIFYASKVMELSKESNYKRGALEASLLLSKLYEMRGNKDDAFHHYKYAMVIKDSLFNQQKIQQVQSIAFKEELKERELRQKIVAEQVQYRNRFRMNLIIGVAIVLLGIALLLWRNNRQKQQANILLQQQKQQTEIALNELRATQSQLVQREKMASLGELTAGIAHEIQNPLNFVNNFSAVNKELIQELQQANKTGDHEEVTVLAANIKENEEKISHHGQRADNIVKGMLQHARASAGHKEPTNINQLAEEYLRLSYQGLRAKDKSFHATIQTNFDESIRDIQVIPQEIGRVLLNLFNNAFYAVQEKKARLNGTLEPVVSVSTKREGEQVIITVKDNGTGMSQKIADKVFQPFFTTKPTGEGTGLGLSLSYDIITKGHGGNLSVNSTEGEGSEFVVQLPAS